MLLRSDHFCTGIPNPKQGTRKQSFRFPKNSDRLIGCRDVIPGSDSRIPHRAVSGRARRISRGANTVTGRFVQFGGSVLPNSTNASVRRNLSRARCLVQRSALNLSAARTSGGRIREIRFGGLRSAAFLAGSAGKRCVHRFSPCRICFEGSRSGSPRSSVGPADCNFIHVPLPSPASGSDINLPGWAVTVHPITCTFQQFDSERGFAHETVYGSGFPAV